MHNSEEYYNIIDGQKVICVDFDNTICLDEWPYIGPIIPGAIEVLKKLQETGHKLILYTQRSNRYPVCCKELEEYSISTNGTMFNYVDILNPAIKLCNEHGIEFWDVNKNSKWELLAGDNSRKVFMDYLIDDHVMGTKRKETVNSRGELCKFVDWEEIDKWCVQEGLYKHYVLRHEN